LSLFKLNDRFGLRFFGLWFRCRFRLGEMCIVGWFWSGYGGGNRSLLV
jgi:hypothetical protein